MHPTSSKYLLTCNPLLITEGVYNVTTNSVYKNVCLTWDHLFADQSELNAPFTATLNTTGTFLSSAYFSLLCSCFNILVISVMSNVSSPLRYQWLRRYTAADLCGLNGEAK